MAQIVPYYKEAEPGDGPFVLSELDNRFRISFIFGNTTTVRGIHISIENYLNYTFRLDGMFYPYEHKQRMFDAVELLNLLVQKGRIKNVDDVWLMEGV